MGLILLRSTYYDGTMSASQPIQIIDLLDVDPDPIPDQDHALTIAFVMILLSQPWQFVAQPHRHFLSQ